MRVKSYFATTVEAAMGLARQELGADALLVNSRRTTLESRQYGEYEVTFALVPVDSAPAGDPLKELVSLPGSEAGQVMAELAELRLQIERMASSFARSRASNGFQCASGWTSALLAKLLDRDMDPEIAELLAVRAGALPSTTTALVTALGEMLRVNTTLGKSGRERQVVALVGPPGSGKTTTLVKLAARYGVAARKPTQLLSTDCLRFAAADQLRAYAAILGIGFQCVETAHGLSAALDEHRHKSLILIDTPGLSERDMDESSTLAPLLASHPEIDVHMVAPASMQRRDLARALKRYEVFGPTKILITKLDETDGPGTLVSEAIRSGLQISYLTTGQQIPEDLEPASIETIAGLLTGPLMTAGRPAVESLKGN